MSEQKIEMGNYKNLQIGCNRFPVSDILIIKS